MIPTSAFWFKAPDGINLFVDSWDKPGMTSPKRVLIIVHGYGEHSGRYKHMTEYLFKDFDRIYAIDLRGHGRSGGTRGHSPDFNTVLSDVQMAFDEIKKRENGVKLYLLAHSYGGLVMLNYLLRQTKTDFELAVISAPLIEFGLKIPAALRGIAALLNKTLYKVQLWSEINPADLSHDPKMVEAYIKDKLNHSKITPRQFFAMEEAMAWVRSQNGALPCPTLFMIPLSDKVVAPAATQKLYDQLSGDKTKVEYPEMYHEIMNETERARVFGDMHAWLEKRL